MTIGDDNSFFVDTTVLVFATLEEAPLYLSAREAIEHLAAAGNEIWISRQVIREYLAVLTRPQAYAIRLTRTEILDAVRSLAMEFRVAEDSASVTDQLLWLLDRVSAGGRQIHNANIVATMLAYNVVRLLTDNTEDFARYDRFITVIPLKPPV